MIYVISMLVRLCVYVLWRAGRTALHVAARNNGLEIMRRLLKVIRRIYDFICGCTNCGMYRYFRSDNRQLSRTPVRRLVLT